jgi:pyridoxal phosphate enzyme (YggS family)
LDALKERVSRAAQGCGREADAVRILLAVKTVPAAEIRVAFGAGFSLIGENRVQEMDAKGPKLAGWPHETHLLGPLQSNKVNAALRWADCIQTVASLATGRHLASRLGRSGRSTLDVMVQVNTSGEQSKAGCLPGAAVELAASLADLEGLRVVGFMTIGLLSDDDVAVAGSYARLFDVREAALTCGVPGLAHASQLSMGMSGDLELAIAEGATMVRVGTAVFGARG